MFARHEKVSDFGSQLEEPIRLPKTENVQVRIGQLCLIGLKLVMAICVPITDELRPKGELNEVVSLDD